MKAPRIPSIFKLTEYNQNRKFNYQPRVYDAQKEKLEKRKRQIEAELAAEKRVGKNYESHLRERISESWTHKENRKQQRNSSYRLLLILSILILLMYFIFDKFDFLL